MIYSISLVSKEKFEKFNGNTLVQVLNEAKQIYDYDVISAFYASLKIGDITKFLVDSVSKNSGGYSGEIRWEKGPVNEEGFIIDINCVCVITFFGEQQISKKLFYRLNLQLAKKALLAVDYFNLLASKKVDKNWIQKIQQLIPQLEILINSEQ